MKHQKPPTERPLYTVSDIAVRDSCSEKTVRRAIDAGLLKVVRIGRSGRAIRITHEAHMLYRMRLRSAE